MKIKEKVLKIKGVKGTFVDSTMEAFFQKETGYLELKKGFMSLVFSKKQTKELAKYLNPTTLAEVGKVIDDYMDKKQKEMKKAGLKLSCICGKCDLPIWIDGKELKQKLGIK